MRHFFLKIQHPITKQKHAIRMSPKMKFIDDIDHIGLDVPHLILSYVCVTVPDDDGADDGCFFDEDELKTGAIYCTKFGAAEIIPKSEIENFSQI